MARALKQSTLEDLSQRVATLAELPNGCGFRLFNKRKNRLVRSDFAIKRYHVTPGNLARPDDDSTLSHFLGKVRALISTDVDARGLELQFYGPRGEIFGGNTHLKTIRSLQGLPPDDDDDTVGLLTQILKNAGLDEELSADQVRRLYWELAASLSGFENKLTKSAQAIRDRSDPRTRLRAAP